MIKGRKISGAVEIWEAILVVEATLVVEVILEKVTNIAMGVEIDKINEFEDIDCRHPQGTEGLVAAGLLD